MVYVRIMKTQLYSLLALALVSFSANAQSINSEKSSVHFTISNMGWGEVEGDFYGMQGDVDFDANSLSTSSFNVCINPATVKTDSEKRDHHLNNEDFFYVDMFPEICFVSTDVVKTADGFKTNGQLTMHGVAKPVTIQFTFENNTFKGTLVLDRYDFGVGSKGSFMVGREVQLDIVCVLQ